MNKTRTTRFIGASSRHSAGISDRHTQDGWLDHRTHVTSHTARSDLAPIMDVAPTLSKSRRLTPKTRMGVAPRRGGTRSASARACVTAHGENSARNLAIV